jgi:hypothetical protein
MICRRRTFDRTNVASSVAVLPQADASAGFSCFATGSSFSGVTVSDSALVGLASASFRFAFFSSVGFSSTTTAISTHSMNAMGAESLLRWPSLTMRVYPPLRSADLGATSSNNFFTALFWRSVARAVRRRESSRFFRASPSVPRADELLSLWPAWS